MDKDLQSIQEARILVETASDAHQIVKEFTPQNLNRLIDSLISELQPAYSDLIKNTIEETGRGNQQDEEKLYQLFLDHYQKGRNKDVLGILRKDPNERILEIGVPLGVIAVILPAENVLLNSLYVVLCCMKSGNTMVVIPHPRAKESTNQIMAEIMRICEKNGLPMGSLSCMKNVSTQGTTEVLRHSKLSLSIVIGRSNTIDATLPHRTPIIFGGTGSTPVFIEKTADVERACQKIIDSRSFDNGLLPAAEQYIVADGNIAYESKEALKASGAYFMSEKEEKQLLQLIYPCGSEVSQSCIGKSACELAKRAGFSVADNTKVLVSEQPYILEENPYAEELKMPILTFYLEPDWLHACEKCIELLKVKRSGHTLAIHSRDWDIIREFALKKPVARMIINGTASIGSLGINSELPLSMILGSMSCGRGITAANVTAADLTYVRKLAYPKDKEFLPVSAIKKDEDHQETSVEKEQELFIQLLRKLTEENLNQSEGV